MFNHSNQNQNVVWERDPERLIITYKALRDIPVGEELCKCTMWISSRKSNTRKAYHMEATSPSRIPTTHQTPWIPTKSLNNSIRFRSIEPEKREYRYKKTLEQSAQARQISPESHNDAWLTMT
jgi:hypothetical protein